MLNTLWRFFYIVYIIAVTMIKNIIFDMGGVLINWNPNGAMAKMGLSDSDRELVMNTVFRSYHWPLLDAGYYNEEQIMQIFRKQLPEHLHKVVESIVLDFGNESVEVIPGMPELVKKLKDNGYGLYLLTNAGPRQPEYWKNVEGHENFDGVFVSSFYGLYKPERTIFSRMLSEYNLKPDECVFVDDLALNCAGAFLSGIKPVLFKGKEELSAELEKLGVDCH